MMWWRGRGLWLGLLVAIVIILAGKAGPSGMSTGFLVSAVAIHFLKDEESSLYSFPVRYWPPLLLICAVLVFIGR